jgi:hypothetical protein
MKNKKLTIEEIAEGLKDMLNGVKTLADATIEEMDEELRKTSTCIVVDKDEVRSAGKEMALRNGKVGCYFLDVNDGLWNQEVPLRRFIKSSIEGAYEDEKPERFVSDARDLARMLTAAANRVERDIRHNTQAHR